MTPPVFVKIDRYKELTGILKKIHEKVQSANATIEQIDKIKAEEDNRLQEWKEIIEVIQGRLDAVGEALHQR